MEITEDDTHSTLRIKNTTLDNAGSYRVKATNKAGSDAASFEVFVKGELKEHEVQN